MNRFKNSLRHYPLRFIINRTTIFSLFLVLLSACPGWGKTYYIDQTCSSSGNGTTTTCGANGPFKTWAELNTGCGGSSCWAAGNTYAQKGGTTTKVPITVGASGTNDSNRITITSYGTGKAILDGSRTISSGSWTANDPVAGTYSITSTNGNYPLYEDDVPLKWGASASTLNAGETYWAVYVKNYYKPTSGTPSDHTLTYDFVDSWGIAGAIYTGSHNYLTIDNLSFRRWGKGIVYGSTVPSGASNTGITVTNCDFDDIGIGIGISNKNATSSNINISNNTFSYCGSSIEFFNSGADTQGDNSRYSSCTIANNTITYCSQGKGTSYFWTDNTGTNRPRIADTGNDTEGIGTQSLDSSSVYGNTVSGKCAGIIIYTGYYHTGYDNNVYRNFINTEGIGLAFWTELISSSWYNNKAYYNIIMGDLGLYSPSAAAVWIGNLSSPSGTNYFYNNIVKHPRNGITGRVNNYEIKNNVFYASNPSGMSYYIGTDSAMSSSAVDRNLYYPTANYKWGFGGSGKSFAQWNAAGFDLPPTPAPGTDPKFTNGSGTLSLVTDFTLQADSLAKWDGVYVGLTTDYVGNPVYRPPSIGAYEYIQSMSDSIPPVAPKNLRYSN